MNHTRSSFTSSWGVIILLLAVLSCNSNKHYKYEGSWYSRKEPVFLRVGQDHIIFYDLLSLNLDFPIIRAKSPKCLDGSVAFQNERSGKQNEMLFDVDDSDRLLLHVIQNLDTFNAQPLYRCQNKPEVVKVQYFPNLDSDSLLDYVEMNLDNTVKVFEGGKLIQKLA